MKSKQKHEACDIFEVEQHIDKTLRIYFADRQPPPSEVREHVSQKLRAAARADPVRTGTPSRWVWGVALYNFLISAALVYALMLLLGPGIIVLAVGVYVTLSLIATAVIITVSLGLLVKPVKPATL